MKLGLFLLSFALCASVVLGHGYMSKPFNRNGRDSGLSGGGTNHAYDMGVNGTGGLCGDRIGSSDHPHYGNGALALQSLKTYKSKNCYKSGGTIEIETVITANHKGFMRWYLCPLPDPAAGKDATAECLAANRLQLADGSGTDVIVHSNQNLYKNTFKLPDVECERCVLQWWWRCGNNWGGQGVAQEQFWNCADIMMTEDGTCPDTPVPGPDGNDGPAPPPAPVNGNCWSVTSWWPNRGCSFDAGICQRGWGTYRTEKCCINDDATCAGDDSAPVTPAPVAPTPTPPAPAKLECVSAKSCVPDAYCKAVRCSELSLDHGLCKEVEDEREELTPPAPAPTPAADAYEAADCNDFKKKCAPTCTTAEHGWGPKRAQCYGEPPQYWCQCNDGYEPAITVKGGSPAPRAEDELLQVLQ